MSSPARSPGPKVESSVLFRRWQSHGDRHAREELIRRHLPLAHKLARRYARTPEPLEDLVQVASLGLVKAVDRFDPDRGIAFTSFAVPTILGELKRHFRDKGRSVHLPRRLQELTLKVQEAETKLSRMTGRSPTVVEIAQALQLETEVVLEALEAIAANQALSLDAQIESDADSEASSRHELVGADDQGYESVEVSISLESAVRRLPETDRELLTLRYRDQLTQREIASRIGVSQMQVSRMLRRITNQLREPLEIEPRAGEPTRRAS
jgi:RNA polymerase sigma-B factor